MIAITENAIPAIVPIAKSNQKTSSGPSESNGKRPGMVGTMSGCYWHFAGIALQLTDTVHSL